MRNKKTITRMTVILILTNKKFYEKTDNILVFIKSRRLLKPFYRLLNLICQFFRL